MPAQLKPAKIAEYSMEIGNMIAEAFIRPEQPHFSGATQYEQVFKQPDFSLVRSNHLPKRRTSDSSIFGGHTAGAVFGPIDPRLLPFSMEFIGYPALALLRQNILLQNIVTVYAEEMTKKWAVPTPGDESVEEGQVQTLLRLDKKWKGQELFRKALTEMGFSGGCLVFIDVGDEQLDAPLQLDPVSIPQGSLKGFRIIEPMNVYAMGYNAYDPLAENYFVPQYWNVQGKDVHASRFLYFAETDLPLLLKPAYMFFGIPLPQMLLDYLYNFERSRDAAARALRNHSLLGLMTDLSTILQTGVCSNNPQSVINRLRIMQATRDQDGIALLNKETEEFFQITTPLTGMMELVSQQLELLSLVTRIPVTKLFLTPPKGFSSTDEMSEQNWAQVINGRQTRILTENVRKFHQIITLDAYGTYLENLDYDWPDVRDMNAKEKAELQNQLAQRDAQLVGADILDATEVRERMSADDESGYGGIYIGDDWEPENPHTPPAGGEGGEGEEGEENLLGKADSGSAGGGGKAAVGKGAGTPSPAPKPAPAGDVYDDVKWEESKHPRAKNGQFGKGGGTSTSPQNSGPKYSITNKQKNGGYMGMNFHHNGKKVGIGRVAQQVFDDAVQKLEKDGMPISTESIRAMVGNNVFGKIKDGKNGTATEQIGALVYKYSLEEKAQGAKPKEYKIPPPSEKKEEQKQPAKEPDTSSKSVLMDQIIYAAQRKDIDTFNENMSLIKHYDEDMYIQLEDMLDDGMSLPEISKVLKQMQKVGVTPASNKNINSTEPQKNSINGFAKRSMKNKHFSYSWTEDAQILGEKLSTTVPEKFSKSELTGIQSYCGNGYHTINDTLREKSFKDFTPGWKERVQGVDKAIENTIPLDEEIIVKRTFSSYINKQILALKENEFFNDNAFVSTSINNVPNESSAERIRIILPKGTKGLFIPAVEDGGKTATSHPNEAEFLLPRGAGFIVHSRKPFTLKYIGVKKEFST